MTAAPEAGGFAAPVASREQNGRVTSHGSKELAAVPLRADVPSIRPDGQNIARTNMRDLPKTHESVELLQHSLIITPPLQWVKVTHTHKGRLEADLQRKLFSVRASAAVPGLFTEVPLLRLEAISTFFPGDQAAFLHEHDAIMLEKTPAAIFISIEAVNERRGHFKNRSFR